MSRKLIAFDFDGTLVDSHTTYTEALKEFSESRGLPWDTDKMAIGYIDPLKYDLGWGVPLEAQPAIFDEMNDFYFGEQNNKGRFLPTVFDGTEDVLAALSESYELAIVTARERKSLLMVLERYGLTRYFPHYRSFCCAKERGYAIKPAPDALQCLLRDTRHDPADVAMIGDTSADIRMANAAGAKSIAVLWGMHPQAKLAEHNPTLMLEKIVELPDGVRGLFRP